MKRTLAGQLFSVIWRHRWRYVGAFFALVVSNALMIGNPLLLKRAVAGGPWWGLVLLGVASLSAVFRYLMRVGFISISRDAELDLRAELFGKLQRQDQGFYDRHEVGDLMSRLVNDIARYRDVMGPGIMYPAFSLTILGFGIAALFFIEPKMAPIALIPVVLLPVFMLAVRGVLFRTSKKVQRAYGEMSVAAQEAYSGVRLVKGYVEEEAFLGRFRRLCGEFFRHSLKLNAVENVFYPAIGLVGKWTTVLLVVSGSVLLVGGGADFASFMWVQGYLLVPIIMLGWVMPLYQRARASYERILKVYEEPLLLADGEGVKLGKRPKIACIDCRFAYPGNREEALKGVSALFSGLTGITGPPGGGKSTLFHLFNRDYPFAEGMISIDGVPIERYALEEIRQKIAVVEQEPFLFSRTLRENIALARPGADVSEVVRLAQLEEMIAEMPAGLETPVGERGVTLSGGQKQRVAIARALLANAPILLLDDCLSALDVETAKRVFEALKRDRTTVIITHNVEVLQAVDHLIYMEGGRVVEAGPPMEHTGPFAKMRAL